MIPLDPAFIAPAMSLLGGGILTGIGFILRTLNKQNEALAVLVARVGTYDIGAINADIIALKTDVVRMWQIHDDYMAGRRPTSGAESATATLANLTRS